MKARAVTELKKTNKCTE